MRRLVILLPLLLPGFAFAQAQGIPARLQNALDRMSAVAAETFGRSLPLPSASAGVSYAFDAATGNFQRQSSTFGQVYLDRADPIGARKFNLQFAYQYVTLTEIDGQDADDLRDPEPIYIPGKAAAIAFPRLGVDATLHQFLFAATYGVTEDLEISLAVPLVYSSLGVQAQLGAAAIREDGSLARANDNRDVTMRSTGVGDILLRAKYRILDSDPVHVAAGLLLRLPSGDIDQLHGVGFFEVAPALLASTRVFELAPWARLQGHLNASVGFNTEDVGASEARWGIGLDWGVTENVTAAVAVLGRNQFARVAPAGFFDFPRCPGANLVTCASTQVVRDGTAPIFGLSGGRPDYYDIAIGGRGALWRDTVFAFASVVVPLNDGFIRTAPIPLVGIEATF